MIKLRRYLSFLLIFAMLLSFAPVFGDGEGEAAPEPDTQSDQTVPQDTPQPVDDSGESGTPAEEPEQPGEDDPSDVPGEGGEDDPSDEPEQPGEDDPSKEPEQPGEDDPSDEPEQPGEDDPSDEPEQPGEDDPSDEPEQPGEDDPSDEPEQPGEDDPSDEPGETDEIEEPVDEPADGKIAESSIKFSEKNKSDERTARSMENAAGELAADAFLWYYNKVKALDCDIAFITGDRISGPVEAGDWTAESCSTLISGDNIVVLTVTGQQIRDALEWGSRKTSFSPSADETKHFLQVSGLKYTINTAVDSYLAEEADGDEWYEAEDGDELRIVGAQVFDKTTKSYKAIDPNAKYILACPRTIAYGEEGFVMFNGAELKDESGLSARTILASYVQSFTKSEETGYPVIASSGSPLKDMGIHVDYESDYGAGRIANKDHVCTPGEPVNVKEASCSEEGYTGDIPCKTCGEILEHGEAIPKLEHTSGERQNAKEATCTEDGYTGDLICAVCGEKMESGVVIPKLGHTDGEPVNAKEATCTEDGYTGDIYCTVCEALIEEGKVIPAGHDYVVVFTWDESVHPATTTATATATRTCKREGCESEPETVDCTVTITVDKLSPISDGQVTLTATAVFSDSSSYTESKSYVISKDKEKCSHIRGTKLINAKDATCVSEGYTGDEICIDCEKLFKEGEVIEKYADHEYEVRNKKEATCTEEGYSGDKYCRTEGKIVEYGDKIAKTAHDFEALYTWGTHEGSCSNTCRHTCTLTLHCKTEDKDIYRNIPCTTTPKMIKLASRVAKGEKEYIARAVVLGKTYENRIMIEIPVIGGSGGGIVPTVINGQSGSPVTGDTGNIALYVILMLLSASGLCVSFVYKRKLGHK